MSTFACNLTVLNGGERQGHHDLVGKLLAARVRQEQLDSGYLITLAATVTLLETAEWMGLEARCCPFLSFALELEPDELPRLRLRGPEGVKPFLDAELGLS